MKYILIILLSFILLGCASQEKQHFKAVQYFTKNKSDLANLCVAEFPSETKYIKGDTIVQVKEVKGEIVYKDCPDGSQVKCPENKTIYKTIYQTDTILKSNTALEAKLRYQINDLEADNTLLIKEKESLLNQVEGQKKEINSLEWQRMGLILLIFVLGIIIFKK